MANAGDPSITAEATQSARYNTSFLQGAGSAVDLDLLLSPSRVIPGQYRVDVYSNEVLVGRRDIDFELMPGSHQVEACLTLDIVQQLGIDMGKLEAGGLLRPDAQDTCHDLPTLIDKATVSYDPARLRLAITVPQVAMQRGMRGYVDPALWDSGVAAAFVNYQLSSNRNHTDTATSVSNNLGLRNGINLGAWRLRNESNFSSRTGQPNRFSSNRSYLQRDITALKGQFSAGDIFSDSQIFDSVRYRGVKLSSDEGMRADSERGYAPIIRGVAETNATVEIRQNNYILYTTSVPPGPFEINDIYPSGSNGDLQVTIIEADGRRRETQQAFSSLPVMVRKGQLNYSVSAGQYNSHAEGLDTPKFFSSTLAYGMSSNMTGILGVQASDAFKAMSLGIGRNTPIGAVSFDVTHSASQAGDQSTSGNSLRMLYAKTFTGTDTNFTLAAYRYSTEGYRTLSEHIEDLSAEGQRRGNSKTRTDLTISQSLGRNQRFGNLYLNATDQRYWGRGGTQSLSAGYSNSWRDLSYNLGVTHTKDIGNNGPSNNDTQVNLSLSFPLGSTPRAPRAFVSANTQKSGNNTQLGVNGYLSENSDTYYSVQAGNSSTSGSTGSASLSTRSSFVDANVGYSQGRGYSSQNLNLAGSVVAHAGGINLGQTLGETFALAEVPGAPAGVKIASYSGTQTGANGFAVIPNTQPYRVNWISLDTRDLGTNIEIENATQQVVPRRGAAVLVRYLAESGRRVQFELFDGAGTPLPFGAALEDATGKQIAISDPNGKALALVTEQHATLTIKWAGQQCEAGYSLPERDETRNYERVALKCLP
ncbi:fimbrial biogenesis outer membrane usher protein [Pseudomonas orientalis]|uniref:fimbria/pilus outer membrane usher protein n=1 Tax=Pseudomonas orientalis TaxID=76758 RepID=UPI001FAE9E0B|nr:fimbria/pilus outer membrane usher protein [Pseudomonas orientalis]UOB26640.1 fimbrial biogenesis outer membrane usher protein [Pseudomonas orientalis]